MSRRTVLITGCSSGFGRLAAKTFQRNGWNVIAAMRSPEKEAILSDLDNVLVSELDVSRKKSVDAAVADAVAHFGSIDVLVNNAGYGGYALFEQFDEKQVQGMFATNVLGPMYVTKSVMPYMRAQKSGTIINVTDIAGLIGLPFNTIYSATKFALHGWSEGLALESAPFNIKVKTVAPGVFETNFMAAADNSLHMGDNKLRVQAESMAFHFAKLIDHLRSYSGKDAEPQDVADMIYACATEEMPMHNVVGVDAHMLYDMKLSKPPHVFEKRMAEMFMPEPTGK